MSLSQAAAYDAPPDKLITLVDRPGSWDPSKYISNAVGGRRKSTYKRKPSRNGWHKKRGGRGKRTNKNRKTRKSP